MPIDEDRVLREQLDRMPRMAPKRPTYFFPTWFWGLMTASGALKFGIYVNLPDAPLALGVLIAGATTTSLVMLILSARADR